MNVSTSSLKWAIIDMTITPCCVGLCATEEMAATLKQSVEDEYIRIEEVEASDDTNVFYVPSTELDDYVIELAETTGDLKYGVVTEQGELIAAALADNDAERLTHGNEGLEVVLINEGISLVSA